MTLRLVRSNDLDDKECNTAIFSFERHPGGGIQPNTRPA